MKPITKKMIESGLVDKHTIQLMQKWGYLDPSPADAETHVIKSDIKESFTQLVDDLDALLEQKNDEGIRETRFQIQLNDPFRVKWLRQDKYGNHISYGNDVVVFQDEMGMLIFPPNHSELSPNVGREFENIRTREWYEVTKVTPLWFDNTLYAYQVEAERFR